MDYLVNKYLILLIMVSLVGCADKSKVSGEGTIQSEIDDLISKANSHYDNDEYEKAVELFDRLIKNDSLVGEYYFKRGYSLSQLNRDEEGVKDYLKSAGLKYREDDCYYNIGITTSIIFDNDSLAIYYFKKALELNPDMDKAKSALQDLGVTLAVKI